jgi:hypothetical protein
MLRRSLAFLGILVFSAFVLVGFSNTAASDQDTLLLIKLYAQETSFWCWAACGQMVSTYLKNPIKQCDQVQDLYYRSGLGCCGANIPRKCLLGLCKDPLCLLWLKQYKFTYKITPLNGHLTWDEIKDEITNNRPFIFAWSWDGKNFSHMMVGMGYKTVRNKNYVEVFDPGPTKRGSHYFITYDAYDAGAHYTHGVDIYNLKLTK